MSDFFEYVREAARSAGFDIDGQRSGGRKALAEATGMGQTAVGRMVNGQTIPALSFLPRLADALSVPDGELIRLAAGASAGVSEQETLPLSSELIDKIRTLREIKKVSAQKLADLMVEQGYQVSRSMIANYEAKRVASIAIDYVAHAAQALGIPFVTLLVEPVQCPACKGSPPEGFTCNTCGGA